MSEVAYIPVAEAEDMTALLWELTDPNPTRGTTGLFPVVNALDGSKWLLVDKTASIPVRRQAKSTQLEGALQLLIAEEEGDEDIITNLRAAVVQSRGKRVIVWDIFPNEIKVLAKDMPQMIEEGRLPSEVMP